eukprot:TRINITY_DN13284_c0_g1_i1.p1 TRINITY_DN13284_c0_g1~~TRINITY_DN13284_c0_g1_i1.p1  ORF type:complete len:555 (-),score=96.20 TRINITY_DN13284_c0_g1_i1:3-1667(-)
MQQDLSAPLLIDPKSDTEVLLEAPDSTSSDSKQRIFSAKSPSRWKKFQRFVVSGISKIGLLYTTLFGVILGGVFGYVISTFNPPPEVAKWIAVPGELFLRSLRALVVPLISTNMIVAMSNISNMSHAGKIGLRSVIFLLIMGFLAVGQGILWILVFRPHFSGVYAGTVEPVEQHRAIIREEVTDTPAPLTNTTNTQSAEELIENILFSIVPDNLIVAAMTPNILSVLSFSVVFGLILARIHLAPNERNLVQMFFNQVNITLLELVEKIIKLTPIAVFFLITGEIGGHPQLFPYLVNLGIMTATIIIGLVVHVLVLYFLAYVIMVRKSPLKLIVHLKSVLLRTFSRASAVITLPKAMEALEKHYGVPNNIARFLMSMGVTLNIDGLAIYLPAAVVFLMEITNRRADIPHLLLTAIVATFGSAGSSAVPGSSLIMIILTWQALFPNERIPIEVSLITAVEWLLERCVACVTLFGDCVMTLVVNEQMKKSEARKLLTAKQLEKQADLIKSMAGLASYHNRDMFYEKAEETRQQRASIVLGAHKVTSEEFDMMEETDD